MDGGVDVTTILAKCPQKDLIFCYLNITFGLYQIIYIKEPNNSIIH